MAKLDWSKPERERKKKLHKNAILSEKENKKIQQMLKNRETPASEDQKKYIKARSLVKDEELDELTITKASRIIGEYESSTPITEKQKQTILKNKFALESKISDITIKQAKIIIENGRKILEKKRKIEENKKKIQRFMKNKNKQKRKKYSK
jgi:outer membrane translocation and assembly module TamA